MNELNIPYGTPYRDMSETDDPYIRSNKKMNEMEIPYSNPNKNMSEQKQMPCPKMTLAMAYVLNQEWETPYGVTEGMHRGTLFPSLDKPFLGGGNKP